MKRLKQIMAAMVLLVVAFAGAARVEASSIRTIPVQNDFEDVFGGYRLWGSGNGPGILRTTKDYQNFVTVTNQTWAGVAGDKYLYYSFVKNSVLNVVRADIKTLTKKKVAQIRVGARDAYILAYGGGQVYFAVRAKNYESYAVYCYTLKTKKTRKVFASTYCCGPQYGRALVVGKKTGSMEHSSGNYEITLSNLQQYDILSHKLQPILTNVAAYVRGGRYLYLARVSKDTSILQVVRYDLVKKNAKSLLKMSRKGASVCRLLKKGMYYQRNGSYYYIDYSTKAVREVEVTEAFGL